MTAWVSLNKVAKWRTFFASWQLGTRPESDGELRAVKNHYEWYILLRAEMSALTKVLIDKGVMTAEEFNAALEDEALLLDADYERRYPGFSVDQDGLHMKMPAAQSTMKTLGFPK